MRKRPSGSASLDVRDFSASVRCSRSRACSSTLDPRAFRRGGFTERSSNSAPNAASSRCTCRVIAEGVRNSRSAAPAMDPAWAHSTRARKSSSMGVSGVNVRSSHYNRENNEVVELLIAHQTTTEIMSLGKAESEMRAGPVSHCLLMSIVGGTASLILGTGSAQAAPCAPTDLVEFEKMTWVEGKGERARGTQ